jgi:hypothetical protein
VEARTTLGAVMSGGATGPFNRPAWRAEASGSGGVQLRQFRRVKRARGVDGALG